MNDNNDTFILIHKVNAVYLSNASVKYANKIYGAIRNRGLIWGLPLKLLIEAYLQKVYKSNITFREDISFTKSTCILYINTYI